MSSEDSKVYEKLKAVERKLDKVLGILLSSSLMSQSRGDKEAQYAEWEREFEIKSARFEKESETMLKLKPIARQFRIAMENVEQDKLPVWMQDIKSGSCEYCALLFGTYLIDIGFEPFYCLLAEKQGSSPEEVISHAWLTQEKIILDIAADQISEGNEQIILTRRSKRHWGFKVKEKIIADYRALDDNTVSVLNPIYNEIVRIIKNENKQGLSF
jgi:hypothetical protein